MTKTTKTYVAIALIVVVLALGIVATVAARPEEPRPGTRAMVTRGICDTIESYTDEVQMYCADGSRWVVIPLDPQPDQERAE